MIGLLVGSLAAYSSTNGFKMLSLGAIAVMPAVLAMAGEHLASSLSRARVTAAPLVVVMAAGIVFVWRVSYRDVAPLAQTARVVSGPFAGIYTPPATAAEVVQMQADLRAVVKTGDRLLVYDKLPAAYLMTDAIPDAPMLWTEPEEHSYPAWRALERYIDEPGNTPTVALRNDVWAVSCYVNGHVDRYVHDDMSLEKTRRDYLIFVRR